MPELPEVQTTVYGLLKHMKGQTISEVWTNYNSPFHVGKDNIKNPKYFKKFKDQVIGSTVTDVQRKAKNILIHLSNGFTIIIHMKMTGHILYGNYEFDRRNNQWEAVDEGPLKDPFNQFIRLVFILSNNRHIVLSDMRKFAKVMIVKKEDLSTLLELKKLGPEPLTPTFTPKNLQERLSRRPKGKIKSVLMDQEIISGIGNIYSDEILWHADIHPLRNVCDISNKEIAGIHTWMIEVLNRSLKLGGDSMSDYRNISGEKGGFQTYHNAYRQHGKPCTKKNCKGTIARLKIGGRSAHFCDTHQQR